MDGRGLPGKATVVVGMRRSGKTTFHHQLRRERLAEGLARIRLPSFNLEDERLVGLQGAQFGFLLEEYGRYVPEVSREIPTAVRGLAWELPPYRFTFPEALRHQGGFVPGPSGFATAAERSRVGRAFLDGLAVGGVPEAQGLGRQANPGPMAADVR